MYVTDNVISVATWVGMIAVVAVFYLAIRHAKRDLAVRERNLCPQCGYDLRATPRRCPECGFDRPPVEDRTDGPLDLDALRDQWPADAVSVRPPHMGEEPILVHATPIELEASLLRSQLDARGMMAEMKVRQGQFIPGYQLQAPMSYHVLVYSGDEEPARAYIGRLRQSQATKQTIKAET